MKASGALFSARRSEDVGDRRQEPAGPERDALKVLQLEARVANCRAGVASTVAAAGEVRVESGVQRPLNTRRTRAIGDDVLIEAKLAAGAKHPGDLAQRRLLVCDRAQHK